jgi:hypothetical protein
MTMTKRATQASSAEQTVRDIRRATKLEIMRTVETSPLPVRRTLAQIGIPKSTFYIYGRLSLCKSAVSCSA